LVVVVWRGAGPPGAAHAASPGVGDCGDDVTAVAEREDREIDPEKIRRSRAQGRSYSGP
jgi:hypothetical protein